MAKEKKVIIYVKGTPAPERGTERSWWLDLFASEERSIAGQSVGVIGLGVKTNFACQVVARSSLWKNNVIFANGVGIIDEDYRGELKAVLLNFKTFNVNIFKGQKLAQLLIPVDEEVEIREVSQEEFDLWWESNPTGRGEWGLGSTGNNSVANNAVSEQGASEEVKGWLEGTSWDEQQEEWEAKDSWWDKTEAEQDSDVISNEAGDKSEDKSDGDWDWKEEDKGTDDKAGKAANTGSKSKSRSRK